jgi:hypothetical protein
MKLPAKTATRILRIARRLEPLIQEEDRLVDALHGIREQEQAFLNRLAEVMKQDGIEEFSFNDYIFEVWQSSDKKLNVGIRRRGEKKLRRKREFF